MKQLFVIIFSVCLSLTAIGQNAKAVCATATSLIGANYKYGGTNPSGFDCSGFTNYVFWKNNVSLARSSSAQFSSTKTIKVKKAKPGDLVFFGKSKHKISHVGIVLENSKDKLKMIHSSTSGGVIVTDVYQSKYWLKRLQKAGRVL